ncbi:MAG: sigma-70 family RNA polymerase sigma factor [Bacteroidales bacterium]|nr:sigma-70 family RNA polymerase sigma factor [Bacteroidales bacterium]
MRHSIEEITDQLKKNPDNGFRLLVNSFMEPVYNHIRRLVVNHADAQDITQETFVKAYKGIDGIREIKSLPAWLMRIATNEALRFLQRQKEQHVALDDPDNTEAYQLAADEYFDYSDAEAVKLQNAIHTLPPKQQAVFNLRYFDDISYEEIASILDTTPQNVKVNYHHAKNKVVELLSSMD